MTSDDRSSASSTGPSRAWSDASPAASLKTGITTETAGAPTADARGDVSSGMAPDDIRERRGHVLDVVPCHGRKQREREDALRCARGVWQIGGRDPEPLAVERMEMQRLEMEADADVRLEQLLHD